MRWLSELVLLRKRRVKTSRQPKDTRIDHIFEYEQACSRLGCNCRVSRRISGTPQRTPQPKHEDSHEILCR